MTRAGRRVIWSVGHGNRTLQELFAVLASAGIETLADVRRHPASKRHPQFGRESLEAACRVAGLAYVHLGALLGGFRDGGYERHLGTREFRDGILRLEALAATRRVAFACAERVPESCHRLFIARELERRGWQVIHLLDAGTAWEPPEDPQLGLFDGAGA